ncbi:MAG: DUF1496 domain-containing protein [Rhodospirillales bacterium]|nr:DUF1496 domain-containing protein [Rhodospirillales bacterium]
MTQLQTTYGCDRYDFTKGHQVLAALGLLAVMFIVPANALAKCTTCFYANKQYSPGSQIYEGQRILTCTYNGTWNCKKPHYDTFGNRYSGYVSC